LARQKTMIVWSSAWNSLVAFRLLADLTEYGHHHVTRPRREKSDPEA